MNELTIGVGFDYLNDGSDYDSIAQNLAKDYIEKVVDESMTALCNAKLKCNGSLIRDILDESYSTSKLPMALRVIRRNDFYRTKVLESLKKELSEEDYINKSFTTTMFEEKDIKDCKRIGVTPEQMIEFLKSLY